jgi:hypothetical protein
MPEKKWTKADQTRAENKERRIVESEAQAIQFFGEVRAAFNFLTRKYGFYGPCDEKIEGVSDGRDRTALIDYSSYRMDLTIGWFFASGDMFVRFQLSPLRNIRPGGQTEAAQGVEYMDLYSLARYLGKGDDSDFLLGDMWNESQRSWDRRVAMLESDLHGVIEGFARVTERHASHVLMGDASQFAPVKDYYEEHKSDYIHGKKDHRQVAQ